MVANTYVHDCIEHKTSHHFLINYLSRKYDIYGTLWMICPPFLQVEQDSH